MGKWRTWFFVLCGVAMLALAMPELGILPAITLIGLPLAVALWSAPALLLFVALCFIVGKFVLPPHLPGRLFAVPALSLLALALASLLLNFGVERGARSWTDGDRNDIALPLKARVIAVKEAPNHYGSETSSGCDGFCLHALLTGTAEKVLFAGTGSANFAAPEPDDKAVAFRLARRLSCPPAGFASGNYRLELPETPPGADGNRAIDLMNLRISEGECLLREEATLREADLVISQGVVSRGSTPFADGFSLPPGPPSASRRAVHVRDAASGTFRELYRRTEVTYWPFSPLLIPVPVFGQELHTRMGWWRTAKQLNVAGRYSGDQAAWGRFLTETLGFQLALDGDDTGRRILGNIAAALDAGRAPTAGEWRAYTTFFENAVVQRSSRIGKPDLDLAIRILEAPRFPPMPRLYAIVDYAARQEPATLPRLAAAFIKRALAGQTWPDDVGVSEAQSLIALDSGISRLPDEALRPYRDEMIRLAKIPLARVAAHSALTRLHVFGEDAVPALLALIEAGLAGGDHFFRDNEYQHPYLAGLKGLCKARVAGASALPQLRTWLAEKRLPVHVSYGLLLFATMSRLGASAEELWPAYSAAYPKHTRQDFDNILARAASANHDCSF